MVEPTRSSSDDLPRETTFRLTYRSRDQIPAGAWRAELGLLFSQARSNNKRQGITGALLVSEGWFVQTLEGDEGPVRELFARIAEDKRHRNVSLLEAERVSSRVFSRWSMAKVADEGADIPLIAHAEGIAVAAPRGDTSPEQAAVLEFMRAAAREAPAAAGV